MSRQVDNLFWWNKFCRKTFGGKCSVEKFGDKNVVGIFGGNAIFDILEPPAFQKYKIHWVLEPLCLCLCL